MSSLVVFRPPCYLFSAVEFGDSKSLVLVCTHCTDVHPRCCVVAIFFFFVSHQTMSYNFYFAPLPLVCNHYLLAQHLCLTSQTRVWPSSSNTNDGNGANLSQRLRPDHGLVMQHPMSVTLNFFACPFICLPWFICSRFIHFQEDINDVAPEVPPNNT